MRLASRPRPTRLLAHPGSDRTDGNAHARLRPTQPCRNVRQPGPRPMSTRPCPASTMDATIGQVPDSACPAVSGRTPSPPPGTPAEPDAMRTGERTNGTEGIRTSSIATTTRRPAGTRRASPVGPVFAAWQPRSAPRWQHCQRDRYHGSDQAAAWCRSSVQAAPRRTALLGRLRVERRANGEASSVMQSPLIEGRHGC